MRLVVGRAISGSPANKKKMRRGETKESGDDTPLLREESGIWSFDLVRYRFRCLIDCFLSKARGMHRLCWAL